MAAVWSLLALILGLAACGHAEAPAEGRLALSIVDAGSGRAVSARVELTDPEGRAIVPAGAMPIRRAECFDTAIPDWLEGPRERDGLFNPYTGTPNFYVDGRLETRLPPGRYRVRVFRGTEFEVAEAAVEVRADAPQEVRIALRRWIDLPAEGWLAADDHLHIARAGPGDDAPLARWMAAEGLHVANLLQGGNARRFDITPQYAFGDRGAHRGSETLLISGQEHPRTHVLGHTLILGGTAPIDLRDAYLLHQRFFREAQRQGALPGYAHWGLGAASVGLAIDAPSGLLSILEVLNFDHAHYETWYDLLDLGLRVAPTAGTDFPCNPYTIPGRDRFYARVDGPLDRTRWLAAVRAGRTFVTNGPALDLEAGGVGVGGTLRLAAPGPVEVVARVRFDPARDDVERLELVRSGEVIAIAESHRPTGELALRKRVDVAASTWLALRASGAKRGETVPPQPSASTRLVAWLLPKVQGGVAFAERFMRDTPRWPSAAHTAALWIDVAGTPSLAEQPRAADAAARWRERLEALRDRLHPERLDAVPIWSVATGDGAPLDVLERDREALLRAIGRAESFYRELERPSP